MRYGRTSVAGIAAVTAAALALTGCGGHKKTGVTRALPTLTGLTLTTARGAATTAGFKNVETHDATGGGRKTDGTWKVCFQTPNAGGSADTGTTVQLGLARPTESCPGTDQGKPSPAHTTHKTSTHRSTVHHSTHRSSRRHH